MYYKSTISLLIDVERPEVEFGKGTISYHELDHTTDRLDRV
jgi:hypothetical protein